MLAWYSPSGASFSAAGSHTIGTYQGATSQTTSATSARRSPDACRPAAIAMNGCETCAHG